MEDKRRAGYARQEKWHEERIDNPSHAEWVLRRAVSKAGLNTVGYEYKLVDEENERWYWFDVACDVLGQLVLIDLVGGYAYSSGSKRRREIEEEKREVCDRKGIPLLQVHKSQGSAELAARLHVFIMKAKDN